MILDSIGHVLPGLLPASFRGVSFFVPDASTEAGRRVAEALFPGVDRAAYDDFGLAPAVISLEGLMVGDDYVIQARALQAAFETPGPGTLIHPWLGAMSVILEEPGEISFSAGELRVARFSASFKRVGFGLGTLLGGTAAVLLAAVTGLLTASRRLGAAPATVSLSRVSSLAAARSERIVSEVWLDVAEGLAGPPVRAALPSTTPTGPVAFMAAVIAVSDAMVALVPAVGGEPAVAPAAGSAEAVGLTPGEAIAMLASASGRIVMAQDLAPSPADRVMLIAAAADAVATAVQLSVHVEHASRTAAQDLRSQLVAAIDAVADAAAGLGGDSYAEPPAAVSAGNAAAYAGPAAVVRRQALDLRAALVADINETIGRLPTVTVVTTSAETDAFVMAGHLFGDRPEAIEAGYRSIVERNRPRHPASLPAGRIEALQ